MNRVLEAVRAHARTTPGRTALDPIEGPAMSYGELAARIDALAATLKDAANGRVVALELDHGSDEVLLELALLAAEIPALSLPSFFTSAQRRHALAASGAALTCSGVGAEERRQTPFDAVPLPTGTTRITFTSGSTGAPKGICLSADLLAKVAQAVVTAVGAEHAGRHLAILPPGILLETVAGLFATLMAGGTYLCPPGALVGMGDPFRPDFPAMVRHIAEWRATSLILVPEYLAGLVTVMEASGLRLPLLTIVAVGGARVPSELIARARAVGLPVRQGYGLTECGSVVSLEPADPAEPGSAGLPLPHMQVRIASDGEIMLEGPLCLGAIGETAALAALRHRRPRAHRRSRAAAYPGPKVEPRRHRAWAQHLA